MIIDTHTHVVSRDKVKHPLDPDARGVVFEIWTFTHTCGMLIPSSGGRCHGPDCCHMSVLSK